MKIKMHQGDHCSKWFYFTSSLNNTNLIDALADMNVFFIENVWLEMHYEDYLGTIIVLLTLAAAILIVLVYNGVRFGIQQKRFKSSWILTSFYVFGVLNMVMMILATAFFFNYVNLWDAFLQKYTLEGL